MLLMLRHHEGPSVAALRRRLAEALGDAAAHHPDLATGSAFDANTEAALRRWQAGVGLLPDGIAGPRCLALLELLPLPAPAFPLSLATVRPLFPATKPANVERYLPYVRAALAAVGLHDRALVLTALGTIRAETEGFVPISELPSQLNTLAGAAPFSAYEPGTPAGRRVGNTEIGDGARFKGRGFVQLTGRDNYTRLGRALELPLEAQPDLANAPEVAALLLATFLAGKADALRTAVADGNLRQARKLVNGGAHGLARFQSVFELAAALPAQPAGSTAARSRKASRAPTPVLPPLTARRDTPDLRDRPYLPPPANLLDAFPPDPLVRTWLPRYTRAGLILDQGQEGACTGFGLAAVVNFLRWRKAGYPAALPGVSPRMLYTLARRYDEYQGEDYEGSSCRGALKGWFHHGVCGDTDWPYADTNPRFGYVERAAETSLGVYYRVSLASITDLQAAIQEVGAVYVSAFTHAGWAAVPRTLKPQAPKGHAELPVIAWDGRPSAEFGHAFALVGFNREGFVIQNSWGASWGCGGFAVLRYDDWLANAMDAWVAALGVAGVVAGRVRQADPLPLAPPAAKGRRKARPDALTPAPTATAPLQLARGWDLDQAYRHSIVLGDDGRVARYLTEDESTRTLLHQASGLPDQWFRGAGAGEPKKRLLLYVHGGLDSENAAMARAKAVGRCALGNGCYPLFVVWRTGLLDTLAQLLARPRGPLDDPSPLNDRVLEDTLARPLARPLWAELKGTAEHAFEASRGGHHLVKALIQLARSWGDAFELHLVGHSAGALWLGHFLSQLAREGEAARATSVHLLAPACSIAFANRHLSPHTGLMKRLHLELLSDRAERDDTTAQVYRKSLLYLVSQALEPDRRTPLLGLARAHDAHDSGWEGSSATQEALRAWREAAKAAGLYGKGGRLHTTAGPFSPAAGRTERASHGGVASDRDTLARTLLRITGAAALRVPVDDLRGLGP